MLVPVRLRRCTHRMRLKSSGTCLHMGGSAQAMTMAGHNVLLAVFYSAQYSAHRYRAGLRGWVVEQVWKEW